jgi:hypothetical protein
MVVRCKTNGEERTIGNFRVNDGAVLYQREEQPDTACTDQLWALRWCLLAVEPSDGGTDAGVVRVLLHDPARMRALKLMGGSDEVTLPWYATDRPVRRTLWIQKCTPTDPQPKRGNGKDPRPRTVEFAVAGPGPFGVKIQLLGPDNKRPKDSYRLALSVDPAPQSLQQKIIGEIGRSKTDPRLDEVDPKALKELYEQKQKAGDAIQTLWKYRERKEPLAQLKALRTALEDLKAASKRLAEITGDKEWAAGRTKSIAVVDESLATLEHIHQLGPEARDLRFDATIATDIGGEVVEIAQVGAVLDGAARAAAGPAKRGAGQ